MAESALSLKYTDLQLLVGLFLGYNPDPTTWSGYNIAPASWSEGQTLEVDRYIQAGIRQFYYPPAVEGVDPGYEWSFLNPITTLETESAYTTGSLAVVSGTCTLTGGTWPAWAATHGTLIIDETEYSITTRDGDTQLTVVGDDVTAAQDGWSLGHAGYQDMPDDFGRVIGDLHFEASVYAQSITVVSEHRILTLLQRDNVTGRPRHAALRFKAAASTVGQRQEIVFWPKPNDDYTLTYRYEAFVGKLVPATTQYPLGGMKYSEVIVESCLAVAEQRANDERGIHWEAFTRLLRTAVQQDRKAGARYFGAMSSGEATHVDPRRHSLQSSYDYTYNGDLIS